MLRLIIRFQIMLYNSKFFFMID